MIRLNCQPAAANKISKLFFGAFASAGKNQHLQIEEFARREIVAGMNHVVNHEKFAACIHAFSAGLSILMHRSSGQS